MFALTWCFQALQFLNMLLCLVSFPGQAICHYLGMAPIVCHVPTDAHLWCFYLLVIMINIAINIHMLVSILLGCALTSRNDPSMRNSHTILHSYKVALSTPLCPPWQLSWVINLMDLRAVQGTSRKLIWVDPGGVTFSTIDSPQAHLLWCPSSVPCLLATMNRVAVGHRALLPWGFCFAASWPWTEPSETEPE